MEKIIDKFDEVKSALDVICGGEDNAMKLWNEYVDAYYDNGNFTKMYINDRSSLKRMLTENWIDNPTDFLLDAVFSTRYDVNDRYVYVVESQLYSTMSIYNEINLFELYYYVMSKGLNKKTNK